MVLSMEVVTVESQNFFRNLLKVQVVKVKSETFSWEGRSESPGNRSRGNGAAPSCADFAILNRVLPLEDKETVKWLVTEQREAQI